MANTNINTMAERIVKYELQMAAEKENDGLNSAGGLGSARVGGLV